jgi:hypothetical protein
MVELTSYGLTGLTAILVMEFCFAYGDELRRTREKSWYGLINNAHVNNSPLVVAVARTLRFRGHVGEQQRLRQHPSCRDHRGLRQATAQSTPVVFETIRGTPEAFHG